MKPSPVSEFPQRAAELPLSPACPGGFSFRTVFITGPSFQDEDALYFGSGLFPLPVSGFSRLIPTDPEKRHRVEDLDPVRFPWSSFPFRIFFPRPDRRKMSPPILRTWTFSALRMSRPVTTVTALSFDSEATNLL